jgi:rubrerythrin
MTSAVAIFLAHAIAMEIEAADRYDELADIMEVHNNPEVATLFRQMADFSRLHAASVRDRAAGHDLPRLRSWEYRWQTPEPPEVGDSATTHYLMTPWHALSFALANEKRGRDFYLRTADTTDDAAVRALARDFGAEESEHVSTLERWLERTPEPAGDWADDPDPAAVID